MPQYGSTNCAETVKPKYIIIKINGSKSQEKRELFFHIIPETAHV